MNDDLKAKNESTKPTSTPSETIPPLPPTSAIQTNPTGNTTEDTQKPRRQKYRPILRLVRIIKKHRREFPKWTDIAIVILTGGIVFLAYMQHRDLIDAGTQTDKIIAADERLATAMENSVAQAQSAFNAANKQAILSQRAWMQVRSGIESPSHVWTVGQPIDIRIKQRNTGRTPALNVRSVGVITIQPGTGDGVFKAPDFSYKSEQYIRSGNITPDGEVFADEVKPFTAEDESRIVSLKVRVYVHGVVEYDDVFGSHHWLNFCSYLLPGQAFAICKYHNEMDKNDK
jgi:hypothetical protein